MIRSYLPAHRCLLAIAGLAFGAMLSTGCADQARAGLQPAFEQFAQRMATEHGFDPAEVYGLLDDSERQQDIIDAMNRPAEAFPWYRYRGIFLKPDRIADGVAFWNVHADLIKRVSESYGVAPHILVAIIGVESRYGSHTGSHRVIDALRTLAFDYPARSKFFRGELEAYLLLTREEGFSPLRPKGSYAGAMGMPQFIASSYRAYAVDYDGDGQRDLWHSLPDVLGSVANYFARHGWRAGKSIAVRADVDGEAWHRFDSDGLKPNTTVGELAAAGVYPQRALPSRAPARLTVLAGEDGNEYWVTLSNFYVITRYNHSALYAMAVHQLGEAIAAQREAQG